MLSKRTLFFPLTLAISGSIAIPDPVSASTISFTKIADTATAIPVAPQSSRPAGTRERTFEDQSAFAMKASNFAW